MDPHNQLPFASSSSTSSNAPNANLPYPHPSAHHPQHPHHPPNQHSNPHPYDDRAFEPYATHQGDSSHRPSDYPAYHHQPPSQSRAPLLNSTSSRDLGRTMPPPNSPPQQGSHHPRDPRQSQPPPHAMSSYGSGPPPPPRAPSLPVGPPSSFPGGRELPALSSITRQGPGSGSMSISSILGGPPASREPQHPQHQYPPHTTAPPPTSGPGFAPPSHPSPRMQSAAAEFSPFRRPQTPDHQRPYDPRGSAAPSPRGPYGTPEVPRYGTPQTYHARHMSASADPSRDPARMSSAAPPPRPSSQPKAYPGPPQRSMDTRGPAPDDRYGRRDEMGRPMPGPDYNAERVGLRPSPYDDRYRAERERAEIEQREHERREYERRERAYSGSDSGRHSYPHEMGQREPPRNQPPYGRPEARDYRDQHWGRPGSDPNFRAPMDHQRQQPEYPPHSAAGYPAPGPPYQGSPERYPPTSLPPPSQGPPSGPPQPYESPERARMGLPQGPPPGQQPPPHQMHAGRGRPEEGPPGPSSIAFQQGQGAPPYDAARQRHSDDASAPYGPQRNLLAIQQENRKGRISPLPQAVQGAQPQQPGPAAEPGIKSEFGRMFSGIGSGVGAMSSPTSAPAGPFTNAALGKRDDMEGPDSGNDATGKGGKGRRRKLKDEDGRDDDSGRATPGHKAKRAKGHQHHHHQYVDRNPGVGLANQDSHHHHHHHRLQDDATPGKGTPPTEATPEKAVPPHHHHHHHGQRPGTVTQVPLPKQPIQEPIEIPAKTKTIVHSQSVIDAAAKYPRSHLGDFIYKPNLVPQRLVPNTPLHRGFSSNPEPLPWDVIKDNVNCILTVKVSKVHLQPQAREEITARQYLWGTDVYTDDSDVVAACIHGGWIKGEWNIDFDPSMLDIENDGGKRRKKNVEPAVDLQSEQLITSPPSTGPMAVPADRDLHVNVLILPKLSKYGSTVRHGIGSREFGGSHGGRNITHDGLSFMVQGVRWVENGAQPQSRLRGKARRERMRKAMQEVRTTVTNLNIVEKNPEKERLGEMKGNWFKKNVAQADKTDGENEQRVGSEGDKENQVDEKTDKPEDETERAADVDMEDVPAKEAVEAEK